VSLIVAGGVNVNFDDADATILGVRGNPVGGYENFRMSIVRHGLSLSCKVGLERVAQSAGEITLFFIEIQGRCNPGREFAFSALFTRT
jgi:hypothetical protein